jgi:hypothetical protein
VAPEEPRQIQPHPAAVDAVPEGDCRHDAQERAEPSQRSARALVERREQEHHGLEALAHDGQKRHRHQGETRADRERRRRRALQLTLQIARVPFHPNDHVGHHQDRNGADDALQTLLLTLRQVLRDHPKQDADSRAQQHTRAHADEHPTEYVAAALFDQERGDDADDERRLEAFPQADHKGREHDRPVLLGKPYLRDRSSCVWDRSPAPGVRSVPTTFAEQDSVVVSCAISARSGVANAVDGARPALRWPEPEPRPLPHRKRPAAVPSRGPFCAGSEPLQSRIRLRPASGW